MVNEKVSEILKWSALILIFIAIILFAAGFPAIKENTFESLVLGLFVPGGLGLIIFFFFSPGMVIASIVLPIIAIAIIIIFSIIEKDKEANFRTLEWTAVALAIASIVITGIHLYQWNSFRQTGLMIGLITSSISPALGNTVGMFVFLFFDNIAPGILLYLIGLFLLIGSAVLLLVPRIKQIDIFRS